MKKKIVSTCLVVLMIFLLAVPAFAAETNNYTTETVMSPQFQYIWQMSAGLGIDSSGKAHYSGAVDVSSMDYTAYLIVSIQKSTNGSWSTVKSWTGSSVGPGFTVQGDYYVTSGTYRVCTTAQVYNSTGSLLETKSAYSAEKTY